MKLKVLEAYTRDVGRGVARIDYDCMDTMKLSTGDIIRVEGNQTTYAKVLPLYPSDEGKRMIRIDGLGRNNAGVAMGEMLQVEKEKCKHVARLVIVEPREAVPPIDARYLTDALEGVPIVESNILMVPYFGGKLSFEVIKTKPEGVVIVNTSTVFKIQNLPLKKEDDKCPTCGKVI